ncbi:MAG: hypothetical protein L6R37_000040 [Teloschistes peruensis]|nr:MAG: hypothetical protein L6R37_000040 [Teloschistes peruensis]
MLPPQRRSAYQPSDLAVYAQLLELPCVRDATDGPKRNDPLCSHCKEILLGEPLLDGNGNKTGHHIALYALPCGHLRCCSCALQYLDAKSIFNHICQACDDQTFVTQEDLTDSLGFMDTRTEPDLGCIPNFLPKKRKSLGTPSSSHRAKHVRIELLDSPPSPSPKTPQAQRHHYSAIQLPTLAEVPRFRTPNSRTPATRHKRRGVLPSEYEIYGSAAPSRFQWTPQGQNADDILDMARNQILPEADDELDPDCEFYLDHEMTPVKNKKRKLKRWGSLSLRDEQSGSRPDEQTSEPRLERVVEEQTYEEFLEEEKRMPKRPKYAF